MLLNRRVQIVLWVLYSWCWQNPLFSLEQTDSNENRIQDTHQLVQTNFRIYFRKKDWCPIHNCSQKRCLVILNNIPLAYNTHCFEIIFYVFQVTTVSIYQCICWYLYIRVCITLIKSYSKVTNLRNFKINHTSSEKGISSIQIREVIDFSTIK